MHEIATELSRWLADGEQIALATVVWAKDYSPRPLGSRMAVASSGQMAGSVSGGCAEGAVFEEAQAVLAGGPPKRLRYGAVDETGWEVGLACGGKIDLYVERMAEIHRQLLEALEAEENGRAANPPRWQRSPARLARRPAGRSRCCWSRRLLCMSQLWPSDAARGRRAVLPDEVPEVWHTDGP